MRITAGGCAPNMSTVSFSSSGGLALGASAINYTVPAGKTLYLTDIDISTDSTTALLVQIFSGAFVIAEKWISTTCPFEFVGIESQMTVGGGQLFKITYASGSTNGAYVINGYLQ